MTTLLGVEGLHAGYGRSVVVRDLSSTVDAGEVVALLGPNGAGKTTTLMTLAGLLRPLAETIRLFDRPLDTRVPCRNARRGLAVVTEDRSLFPALSVRDNLRLAVRGRPGSRAGAAEVLDFFPALVPLLDRKAGLLSGGEQQMLAIGRALATRPGCCSSTR